MDHLVPQAVPQEVSNRQHMLLRFMSVLMDVPKILASRCLKPEDFSKNLDFLRDFNNMIASHGIDQLRIDVQPLEPKIVGSGQPITIMGDLDATPGTVHQGGSKRPLDETAVSADSPLLFSSPKKQPAHRPRRTKCFLDYVSPVLIVCPCSKLINLL
jgi:hypothetical protein